jgi:cytochrome b561
LRIRHPHRAGRIGPALLAARLLWRLANRPLALLPTRFGRAGKIAATLGHYALYALLLAVPIAGIVAQLKRGNALPVFGVWHLASLWPAEQPPHTA